MSDVRTRFAPSPTGFLHLGGARTALYNYAYARAHGGKFILRVEDTDRERYVEGSIPDIVRGLTWLGIEIDESPDAGGPYGPYLQSEKKARHVALAEKAIAEGLAYRCFCTKERLDQLRAAQRAANQPTIYDRRCRNLTDEQIQANLDAGLPYVIRIKMPTDGDTHYDDPIRGASKFQNELVDDQIIIKADGFPTYHWAHAIDDLDMKISHVIRGEEWIPSVPKHLRIFEILGSPPPTYVHLPVILNPKGGKLSKRDGAVHLREYIDKGYLPEAMVNFLALLGWGYPGDREEFTLAEMIDVFDVLKVKSAAPKFYSDKLDHYNGVYIRKMSPDALAKALVPHLAEYPDRAGAEFQKRLADAAPLIQERLVRFDEAADQLRPFLQEALPIADPDTLIPKKSSPEISARVFDAAESVLSTLGSWTADDIEACLKQLVADLDVKVPHVFMAVRVATLGSSQSPPLPASLEAIGPHWTVSRLKQAKAMVEKLSMS